MLLLSLESPLHVAVHVAGCRGDVAVAAYKWMLNERPRLAGPTPLVKPFCPSKLAPCAGKQASPGEVQRERGKEDEMAIMCDRLCGVCVQESAVCAEAGRAITRRIGIPRQAPSRFAGWCGPAGTSPTG